MNAEEDALSSPIEEIAAERRRQVEAEGWSHEHDDQHADDELVMAAICYADPIPMLMDHAGGRIPAGWPWAVDWWKPRDRRRNLIRAAALIVAEIERMDRIAA